MSYCVHCGVELAKSEARCPLCGTVVYDPQEPWKRPERMPYPEVSETLRPHMDRRFFASMGGVILLIPLVITMLCDLLSTGAVTWSAYVAGALMLLYVVFVLPFFFKRFRAFPCLSLDCLAVLLYLLGIQYALGESWFLPVALPITLVCSLCFLVPVLIFTQERGVSFLTKVASILFAAGTAVIGIEIVLSLHGLGTVSLKWSPFALVPCFVLGAAALMLKKRVKLREQIRRRLYF